MKSLVGHTAAITLLLAGGAIAADIRMPVKAPPPAAVAVFSWTGCYVGAGGGYGMFNQRTQSFGNGVPNSVAIDNGGRGWFGTVQVGCDYQVAPSIVVGAFADYDFSGIKGSMGWPFAPQVGSEALRSSWAAGGRIGWLPSQRLLVFASGGYTEARFGQINFVFTNGAPSNFLIQKHTYTGWFVGSGYEYALGWLPGLFWKTEYRFADYGTDRLQMFFGAVPTTDTMDSRKYVHTVRSELVWRFNAGGAATAVADASMRVKAPRAAPAAYSWTGCYVGAGGGYGMFDQELRPTPTPAGAPENHGGGKGWFGTVQAGCDYQAAPNIVIGAMADYDFSGIKGDVPIGALGLHGREKLTSSWAAGARAGWLPSQQLLVFVSGGYTEARFGRIDFNFFGGGLNGTYLPKHTYSGWFLGSGYEYGIGWLPGLFWKSEYRFADYGADRLPILLTANGAPLGAVVDSHKYTHTVRSELVWRFNFGGPVVARY
jgi:outer membrane immunogenic protein